MSKQMRAAIVDEAGGPDAIVIRNSDIPNPGPGQVRIQVAYAALNPLDTHARAYRIKWGHPGFPFTPGYEYAGRVDAVGEGVDSSLLGRRVASHSEWGGNAEYALATASRVIPVPESYDWPTAATFSTCVPTAWHLVHSAGRLQSGMTLLVHSAAGAVGSMVTQIAKEAEVRVIGLAGGATKLEYARQFGADHLVDYLAEDWTEQVKGLTDGRGVDVIIDGNAGPQSVRNYDVIAPLGNVIYIGAMAGQAPEVNVSLLIGKSFSVTGFVQFFHQACTGGSENAEIETKLASGAWRIAIERVFELEEVPEAQRLFEARQLTGRSLIRVGGDL
ncbi:MAG: zinc-binding alcohol dehydrogenase family protein [Gammaproteobacteria bacterium]|nr:MAG: zinc-binding alcohol dehydrogenase family protein [Gammaproteobacteria bacterium]